MLDLETMGKGPSAAIVTIGAVFFDPMTGELGAEFEAHIDLRDSARFGEIDPDTVLWWLGQSDEAIARPLPITIDGEKADDDALLQGLKEVWSELMQERQAPCVGERSQF